jgi:tRNA-2-methylthio-N6-dimethylallyladenosine synthase
LPSDALADLTSPPPGPVQLVGRTRCDRIVVFNGNPRLAGSLVDVSVSDCSATTLMGTIVTQEQQHCDSLLPVVLT